MVRHLAGASILALLAAGAAMAQDHDHDHDHEDNVTAYRVFVGDHEKPQITAFDLTEPDNRWTFDTKGQVNLYSEAGGAVIVAVQSFDDQVNFLTSGISLHSHGDHKDIEVADPAAVEQVFDGKRPFHVVENGGKISINFDRGGYSELVDAHALSEGKLESVRFPQAHAHHGVAVPMGNLIIGSVASDQPPAEEGALPPRVGAQAFNIDGTPAGDLQTCTGLHGEALSGAYLAFGCEEGVLTVTLDGADPVFNMLPYPAEYPKGEMTGTLLGSDAIQVFVGDYGDKALSVIDPVDEPHMRLIELPFRAVDFALDPVHPSDAFVLIEDGTLHRINLLDGKTEASAKVTEPYSMDGDWNLPRPRLAMAGDEVVMTDPNAGLVRRIATADLKEVGTIPVEGKPYNLAVAGGSGLQH
ncbi:hypothetical protein [Paracoccus sp. S3-43]|uniref:hypothetical protein n=1 Tax=Paracoccus sp. S3-43 TaxID=3030011 RepID=UPI0023AF15DF|nr:hypothetical protein [Paracoccus sp. S3-43]WEF24854.1 hypothetical protein PXD02_02550 [Paracoccus sp. S3-43]